MILFLFQILNLLHIYFYTYLITWFYFGKQWGGKIGVLGSDRIFWSIVSCYFSIPHVHYFQRKKNFMNLCAEMLFRFQWYIENLSQELGLGPGFFSISPLRVIRNEQTQIWPMYVANIKVYRPLLTIELIFLIFFFNKNK